MTTISSAIFNAGGLAVLDVETTGADPEKDAVVEVAVTRIFPGGKTRTWSSLVKPRVPIPPEMSAIHHITDDMVANAPSMADIWSTVLAEIGDAIPVAHNARFDSAFLPLIRKNWLCTYRLSRHLWPDSPGHSNQVLRYWLKSDPPLGADAAMHRAANDTIVTAANLKHMLHASEHMHGLKSLQEVMAFAAAPITITTMPFGSKHRGKPMSEVPRDYLVWALNNMADLDDDMRMTIKNILGGSKPGEATASRQPEPAADTQGRPPSRSSTGDSPAQEFSFRVGAHAKKPLKDVPDGYLRWAVDNMTSINDSERAAINLELARRKHDDAGETPGASPSARSRHEAEHEGPRPGAADDREKAASVGMRRPRAGA